MFPAGNYGPGCSTILAPANAPAALGVAANDRRGYIAEFSSRGPGQSVWGRPEHAAIGADKPDCTAPGHSIRAADSAHDSSYMMFSGTHLAAAYAAGVVALMKAVYPGASTDVLINIIAASAEHRPEDAPANACPVPVFNASASTAQYVGLVRGVESGVDALKCSRADVQATARVAC